MPNTSLPAPVFDQLRAIGALPPDTAPQPQQAAPQQAKPNVFDQFDQQSSQKPNVFDQFDQKLTTQNGQPPAATPAAATPPPDSPPTQNAQPDPSAVEQHHKQLDDEYNAMPWYEKAWQATKDMDRIFTDFTSFGRADANLVPKGETVEQQRQKTADAEHRAGWAGTAEKAAVTLAASPTRILGLPGLLGIPLESAGITYGQSKGHDQTDAQALSNAETSGVISAITAGLIPTVSTASKAIAATSPLNNTVLGNLSKFIHAGHTSLSPMTGAGTAGGHIAAGLGAKALNKIIDVSGARDALAKIAASVPAWWDYDKGGQ